MIETLPNTLKKMFGWTNEIFSLFFFFFDKKAEILSQEFLSNSSENRFEIKRPQGALKLKLHLKFSTYSLLNSLFFFLKEQLQDNFIRELMFILYFIL